MLDCLADRMLWGQFDLQFGQLIPGLAATRQVIAPDFQDVPGQRQSMTKE
jgi:hypothetical protein